VAIAVKNATVAATNWTGARQLGDEPRNATAYGAAFVTRLRPDRLPGKAARQLTDLSTIIWVDPSSTGGMRLRGALNGESYRLAQSHAQRGRQNPSQKNAETVAYREASAPYIGVEVSMQTITQCRAPSV
jgi:hypothetical protein